MHCMCCVTYILRCIIEEVATVQDEVASPPAGFEALSAMFGHEAGLARALEAVAGGPSTLHENTGPL